MSNKKRIKNRKDKPPTDYIDDLFDNEYKSFEDDNLFEDSKDEIDKDTDKNKYTDINKDTSDNNINKSKDNSDTYLK